MMSPSLKAFVGAALVVCSFCAQAQQWSDYKCYVLDTEGAHWVHLFEMDPQNLSKEVAGLPGRLILDSFGRSVAEVREVKECLPLDASFRHSRPGRSTKTRQNELTLRAVWSSCCRQHALRLRGRLR